MASRSGNHNLWATLITAAIVLLLLLLVKGCDVFPDNADEADDDGYSGGNYNPQPSDIPDMEQDDSVQGTPCSSVLLEGYGDHDGTCQEQGECPSQTLFTVGTECHHYWDWNNKLHKCGCTETVWCGQYCYEYYYTTECECPPGSYRQVVTRSTWQCVPDGHTCVDGFPEEEATVE